MIALRANLSPGGVQRRISPDPGPGQHTARRDEPPAVRAQRGTAHPRGVRPIQQPHRDGVGPLQPLERLTSGPAALAVHRGEDRDLGDRPLDPEPLGHRGVEVVVLRGRREHGIPAHHGEHAGLDLSEVGPHEHVPRVGCDARPQGRRQVVQPVLGRHPPGRAVARRPAPAQAVVGADVGVEPAVPVGRGDPLVTPPRQQRLDEGVDRAVGLEHPLARVRHVDADRGEQLTHLGRVAQVRGLASGGEPQDLRVTNPPGCRLVGVGGRPRSGGTRDQRLGGLAVDGQPAALQLQAEQRGRRLRVHRRGQAHRGRCRSIVLSMCGLQGGAGPGFKVGRVAQPGLVVAAQVPGTVDQCVGSERRGLGGELEEVTGWRCWDGVGGDAVRGRPAHAGGRAPPAVEEAVRLRDVPGPRERDAGLDQRCRGIRRGPPDPPR